MNRSVFGRFLRILVLVVFVTVLVVPPAAAAPKGGKPTAATDQAADYASGEVLVTFEPGVVGTSAESRAHARVGAKPGKRVRGVDGLELVELPDGVTVSEAMAAYRAAPGVASVQPNYRYDLAGLPNDPLFGQQWGLNNTGQDVRGVVGTPDADIDAPEAWALQGASGNVLVAVVDSGVDYNHPDLAGNIWCNPDEIAGNGLDDDHNGYIDDIHGIDSGSRDTDPMDSSNHGTHVAGIIGAAKDNSVGVAGVGPGVTIMPLKIFDEAGQAFTSQVLEAFVYAKAEGVRILNCSWGSGFSDSAMSTFIQTNPQMLFVCAAGNSNINTDLAAKFYPACYGWANVLSVAASDSNDAKASFSNTGTATVDVFAPGVNIMSTIRGSKYLYPPASATSTVLFADDFTTTSAWAFSSSAGSTPWSLSTLRRRSSPSGLALLGYHNDESSYADTVLPLDLTTAQSPWLEFYLGHSTEPGYDWVSWGLVDKTTVPETYVELGRRSGNSATKNDHVRVDLSDFAGSNKWNLRLSFTSDVAVNSADGYVGAWVDDVKVSNVVSPTFTIYQNQMTYLSGYSASLDWSTARAYVPWAYDAVRQDWYYSSSQLAENTWLFLKAPINLASGPADLSFDLQYDLTGTVGRPDAVRVYASPDNVWDTRATSANKMLGSFSGKSGYYKRTVSLDDFAGDSTVYIAFQLVSSMTPHALSARLDDLVVSGNGWQQAVDYGYAYDAWNGTSMAAPHVTGIAGLLLSRNPSMTTDAIKSNVMTSVDHPAALVDLCATNGRVNAASALGITNAAPVAVNDTYATARDTLLSVPAASGLLANDYDPAPAMLPLSAKEVDVSNAHGAVTLNGADGSFTYQPAPGFVGEATFTYSVTDAGGLESAPATVRISVQAPGLMNVYRFYNRVSASHFYTSSVVERAIVNATWPGTFTDEGVAYTLAPSRNDTPLYRFFNMRNGSHFYTASEEEKARVIALWPDVYRFEGVAYNVSLSGGPFSIPVYRFYNVRNGSHFYTASDAERDRVAATWPDTYRYEGAAFYVRQ